MAQPAPVPKNQQNPNLPAPVAPPPLPPGVQVLPQPQETAEDTKRKIANRAELIEKRGAKINDQIEDLTDQQVNQLGTELLQKMLKLYQDKSTYKIFLNPEEGRNFQRLKNAVIELSQNNQLEFELSNSNIDSLRTALELSVKQKSPLLPKAILEVIKSTNIIDQIFCSASEGFKKDLITYFTEISLKSESSSFEPYLETIVDKKFITNLNLDARDRKTISNAINNNVLFISYNANIKHINAQILAPEEKKYLILEEQLKLLKNPTLFAFNLLLNANTTENIIKETTSHAVKKYNKSLANLLKEINDNKADIEKIDPVFFDNHERNESALRAIITCNKIIKLDIEPEILKIQLNPLSLQIVLKYYAENKTDSALSGDVSKYLLNQITANKTKLEELQNPNNLFLGIQSLFKERNLSNDESIKLLLLTNQKISNNLENSQSKLLTLNEEFQSEILNNIPVKNLTAIFKTVLEQITSSKNDQEQLDLAKLSRVLIHQINRLESHSIGINLNLKMDQAIYDNQICVAARKEFIEERIEAQKDQVNSQSNIFRVFLQRMGPAIIGFDNIKLSVVNSWQRALYEKDMPLALKLEIAEGISKSLLIFPFLYNSKANVLFMENINHLLPEIYASKISSEEKLTVLNYISTIMRIDRSAIDHIDPNNLYTFFQDKNLDMKLRESALEILSANIDTDVHPFEFTDKHLQLFRETFSDPKSNEEVQVFSLKAYHKLLYQVDWPKQKDELDTLTDTLIKKVLDPKNTADVKIQLFALLEEDLIVENLRKISDPKNNNINRIMDRLKTDLQAKENDENYNLKTFCLRLMLKVYPDNRKNEVMELTKDLINKLYKLSKDNHGNGFSENAIINIIVGLKKDFKEEGNKFFDAKIKETEKDEEDNKNWERYKSYLNGAPIAA